MFRGYFFKRAKVLFLCFAVLSVSVIAGGCSTSSKSLTFADFKPDSKGYTFPGTEWGMSAAAVEKALGFSLTSSGQGSKDDTGALYTFFDGGPLSFNGIEGRTTFQFKDDQLWAAGISLQFDEDGSQKYQEMRKSAQEVYGPETESVIDKKAKNPNLPAGISSSSYIWERADATGNKTKASLSCSMRNQVVQAIAFDVTRFPIPE